MTDNYNYLFQYLEKEEISFDKSEFVFQIQSHPDYPSIIAIADTLSFFNILNGTIKVEVSDIELLPDHFIVLLNEENKSPQLCFIERLDENTFYCTKDIKKVIILKSVLESRWSNIVLLVEKSDNEELKLKKNKLSWVLPLLCLVLFLLVLFQFKTNLETVFFFAFPVIGILFSIAALKDLFGAKSKLINDFCNIAASTSCDTVVGSDKWKIFKIFSFSDLSIVFFSSQFLGLLLFAILGHISFFISFQKIVLLLAVPVIALSFYFQKFVEKKWCPVCLVISSVILIELFYLVLFTDANFRISNESIILFCLVFTSTTLVWSLLKKILMEKKDLKESQLKSNRFLRNYTVFKNTLFSKERWSLPNATIVLGNKESKTSITIISNPFCGHCKGVHEIMERILEKYHADLHINIIFKVDLEKENDDRKKLFKTLYEIYKNDENKVFEKALKHWFNTKNLVDWLCLYDQELSSEFDPIFHYHNEWCVANDFIFTPTIFINGYEFPDVYERSNLEFFIDDLIEDSDFQYVPVVAEMMQ